MTHVFIRGHAFAEPQEGTPRILLEPSAGSQLRKGASCMESQQPQMFGTYRVIRPIDTGGFAQVYLVKDNLGQQWALKQIKPEIIAKDPKILERFAREAQIQANLS